jgi:putative colanic acid biosynthesis glycosyltransferase
MPPPLISILIVCRNPGPRLRDALASIDAQTLPASHLETVVVDGASTDGTSEWLASRRADLGALHSGTDAGIYDAMNHALRLARGDWVLFLGADDFLATREVLSRAAATLRATSASVLVGEARYTDGRRYAFAGTRAAIRRNFVHHQAAFYRRTLFSRHGDFDTTLRLQADYDHNLRLLRAGEPFASLALHVATCAPGGASDSGRWANYREEIRVRARHFPAPRRWLWNTAALLRFVLKNAKRASSIRTHA